VPTVADVPEGDVAGPLSRVPALPSGYVVRDELDALVDAVVGTAAGGAVGLTGEPAGVGLHGIGGIGKSVLAAALATDDRVRRRFPDGVYWVTVGERPDVLALQLDLMSQLGVRADARTRVDAAQALGAALADKRVLLVVDDVWSVDDAQDLRVTGPRGRLLYTSRDQGVVDAAGATAHRVGVLSPAAARALVGECSACPGRRCRRRPTGRSPQSGTSRSRWRCSPQRFEAARSGQQDPGRTTGEAGRVRGRRSPPTSPATPTSTAPTPTPRPSAR